MRTYKEKVIRVKDEVYCNCCGRKLENEDFLEVEKQWGYFSKKDGTKESFELCEACYDKITAAFKFPPEKEEMVEF